MFNISFNSINIPSFVKVRAVDFSVLPEVRNTFKNISGGNGLVDSGTTLGSKIITVSIIIVPTATSSLTEMSRELAYWLRGDNFKLSDLVISDEATMTYRAKINNQVDVSDLLYAGDGSLEFIVPSGTAKSSNVTPVIIDTASKTITINYNGTAPSFPKLTWKPDFASDSSLVFNLTCVETGQVLSVNTGDFTTTPETIYLFDNEKMVVKRNGLIDMKLINFTSDWIKFASRGTYIITYNASGTMTCTVPEFWL